MVRWMMILAGMTSLGALPGCNTVEGAAQDVKSTSQAIRRVF